jgi:hypothetical protein
MVVNLQVPACCIGWLGSQLSASSMFLSLLEVNGLFDNDVLSTEVICHEKLIE